LIVTFLSADGLDNLVKATGFDLSNASYEYKYFWLLERIGMLRKDSEAAAILHDNPDKQDLISVIQKEREWSRKLQETINALQTR
jgi:hypothetical protein